MLSAKNINELFERLIADETFCRLVAYNENPLSEDKADIVNSTEWKTLMKDIIRFSPQINDIEQEQRVRMCLYKNFTKMSLNQTAVRNESIEIDLYVPHKLVRADMRSYLVESKIVDLLENYGITSIGFLDYVDGFFVPIPPISGYSLYKMMFTMKQGRLPAYGQR